MPFWGHLHTGSEGLSEKAVTFGGISLGFLVDFWWIFCTKNRSHERGHPPAKHQPMFGGFWPSFGNAIDRCLGDRASLSVTVATFWAIFGQFLVDFLVDFLHQKQVP